MRPSSPRSRMAWGVLATLNRRRVARLTLLSVARADSITAISSSNGVPYSSSVVGCGLSACNRRKISARLAAFTVELLSLLAGFILRGAGGGEPSAGALDRGSNGGSLFRRLVRFGGAVDHAQFVLRLHEQPLVALVALAGEALDTAVIALAPSVGMRAHRHVGFLARDIAVLGNHAHRRHADAVYRAGR